MSRMSTEWVGARVVLPEYVAGMSQRAQAVLLVETRSGYIVATEAIDPAASDADVAAIVRRACASPGPGGAPSVLRVADGALGRDLARELGGTPAVRVAPTPELDVVVRSL